MTCRAKQIRLWAACSGVALLAGLAHAQSALSPAVDTAADAGGEEVIITGTRIARPEIALPSPVESFSAANLAQSGKTNLADFLADSPALAGSITNELNSGSNTLAGGTGVNLLDLRNLGTARTLVLVNGRRHVNAFPGENSVDINTIPLDLIDRVDVLTGGASAIYGADAVSGVVNFVLKRKFEGLNARSQFGISSRGDNASRFASIIAGKNFADERGNLTLAYEYNKSDRFSQRDRAYTGDPAARYELRRDPSDFPDDPNKPDRILFNNLSWADSARNGAVDLDGDGVIDFEGSGRVYDTGQFLPGSGGRAINSTSNTPVAGYFGDFAPRLKSHNANALFNFEFSPAFQLFAEAKYVRTTAFTEIQPSFDFGTYLTPDNYFLNQRFGEEASANGAFVNRDNFDLGVASERAKRDTYRGVVGIEGDLSKGSGSGNLHYELSYVYGKAKSVVTDYNQRLVDRYYAALDTVVDPATGKPTCRINLPGETLIDQNNYGGVLSIGADTVTGAPLSFTPSQCVPLSILGENVASEAAKKFAFVDNVTRASSSQQVVSATLRGDLGFLFDLPGGPIGFAIGAEYRREATRSTPSAFQQAGYFEGGNQILPSSGHYDVKEVYGELNVPLLAQVPFAENLSFGAAGRLSDYSTIGHTVTWKVDGTYSPVRDIAFRATYSKAVRAPNITELFSPLQGTFEFLDDPCDPTFIAEGTQYRVANCKAALTAAGLTPAQIDAFSPATDPEQSTSQTGLQGGNPRLREETAKTWTAGVVLRPRFIPGLAVTADWYDIKITNAINTPDVNEVFKLCVDQPTLNNPFCQSFQREQGTGFIKSFVVSAQNVAAFTTSGLEVTVNYMLRPAADIGTFNLHLVGGYLNDLTFIATVGGVPEQQRNRTYRPKYKGALDVTWNKGPVSIDYGLAWQGRTQRFTTIQLAANPDLSDPKYFYLKERWEHDISVSYDVGDRFQLYGGINNFTDQQPDIAALAGYPVSAVGRFFYVGARIKLGRLF
ncbi:MAG TPA: TonB-dependent receptor [Sphingomonas sp.]|nr:TonB-dependent receptor [Sphingomonas sp.]